MPVRNGRQISYFREGFFKWQKGIIMKFSGCPRTLRMMKSRKLIASLLLRIIQIKIQETKQPKKGSRKQQRPMKSSVTKRREKLTTTMALPELTVQVALRAFRMHTEISRISSAVVVSAADRELLPQEGPELQTRARVSDIMLRSA